MIKSQAIILRVIKHTDNSFIVYAYTDKFGRQTYIVSNGTGKSRWKNKISLLQPLFLLEIDAYFKQQSNFKRIKEFKLCEPLISMPFDIKKSTIAMFIAEILYKTVREEEENKRLFDFIYNSVLFLDKMNDGIENFHLYFLVNLSKFLGIAPNLFPQNGGEYFDIKSGILVDECPKHLLFFDFENTRILVQMLKIQVSELGSMHLNRVARTNFLNSMSDFYNYHFDNLGKINSLKVFSEIFD